MSDLMVVALGAILAIGPIDARTQDQAGQQQAPRQAPQQGQAPGQGQAPAPSGESPLRDPDAQAGYGFGLSTGRMLKAQSEQLQLDPRLVARGIVDALTDAQPLLSDEQLEQVMEAFEQRLIARQEEFNREMADRNRELGARHKAEGDAYRAEHAQKQGVRTTASGLLIETLEEGQGNSPALNDTVTINYKGMLLDGTVFDSTEDRQPMTFPVAEFIEGWKETLQLMKVGGKSRVVIPPELAYGESGTPGGPIPPSSTLVFEIELLGIK